LGYLVLAVITMLTLASASICAAQGLRRLSAALFVLAALEVGSGFSVRRRVMRGQSGR
jgi:NADH:ubiquinone oxidoreductase subunit 3 (subunit A)